MRLPSINGSLTVEYRWSENGPERRELLPDGSEYRDGGSVWRAATAHDIRIAIEQRTPVSSWLVTVIGEALYGERWQASLAAALGVHKDTVQDWRQGRTAPQPSVYAELLDLLRERAGRQLNIIAALEDAQR